MQTSNPRTKKRIIVIGAGFGGLATVKALKQAAAEIIIFDQHNYHLFQPFLYQIATANLSPADIALPIRHILKKQSNVTIFMEKVTAIDKANKVVSTNASNHYPYDYLVIATGARHNYFGHDKWMLYTFGLKCLKEAISIREKILFEFERAETTLNNEANARCLTIVIIGAGPTGVELAGAIQELTTHTLANEFKHIRPTCAEVILIESSHRILNAFPEKLAKTAESKLRKMGVKIFTQENVIDIEKDCVKLSSRSLKAHVVIWSAGIKASEAATLLDVEADKKERIIVNPDFSIPELPNVFAIGDTCAYFDQKTKSYLPGIASVAKQQGKYVGSLILQKLKGRNMKPFRYRNYGQLATIGRKYAIADFKKIQMDGIFTYALWWIVHIYFLIGFRNRFAVALNWLWSHFTFQRSARLIIENSPISNQATENKIQ